MELLMIYKISPRPFLPSGPGSAPEGLMPRREALWAGGQRGEIHPFCKACLPPSAETGAGRQGRKEEIGLQCLHNYGLINMWTRRDFLRKSIRVSLSGFVVNSLLWKFVSSSWAKVKQLLPKGFPKDRMINMNPAEIDNRDLVIA